MPQASDEPVLLLSMRPCFLITGIPQVHYDLRKTNEQGNTTEQTQEKRVQTRLEGPQVARDTMEKNKSAKGNQQIDHHEDIEEDGHMVLKDQQATIVGRLSDSNTHTSQDGSKRRP